MEAIKIEKLDFSYGKEQVLENIEFSLPEGHFCLLLGENGAGKSTFLRLLLGELTAESGQIRIFGQDVERFKDWQQISYAAQNGMTGWKDFRRRQRRSCRRICTGASVFSDLRAKRRRRRYSAH